MPPQNCEGGCLSNQPNQLLAAFSYLLPKRGPGLDVACGTGQNSVFLAARGLRVLGVDRSRPALVEARNLSTHLNLNVTFIQSDLSFFHVSPEAFCVIICFKYRDPALYRFLREALRPGGLLFYETYTHEHLHFGTRPQNTEYLLQPREMLSIFGDWQVIFYREEWLHRGMASLVARKPLRGTVPAA